MYYRQNSLIYIPILSIEHPAAMKHFSIKASQGSSFIRMNANFRIAALHIPATTGKLLRKSIEYVLARKIYSIDIVRYILHRINIYLNEILLIVRSKLSNIGEFQRK